MEFALRIEDFPDETRALVDACRRFGERGWCRATSGNFSLRVAPGHCAITQSGRDKQLLETADLMLCDLDGVAADPRCRPSAEAPLHCALYRLDATVGAVLHTHSVTSTVLSRRAGSALRLSGFEMQKAFTGIATHEADAVVTVFPNDQDMPALAARVADAWHNGGFAVPGFLIAGHGLYAWGRDLDEAVRHVEGFEFLFECAWREIIAGQA